MVSNLSLTLLVRADEPQDLFASVKGCDHAFLKFSLDLNQRTTPTTALNSNANYYLMVGILTDVDYLVNVESRSSVPLFN